MPNPPPGLPNDYKLNLPAEDAPADISDYADEHFGNKKATTPTKTERAEEKKPSAKQPPRASGSSKVVRMTQTRTDAPPAKPPAARLRPSSQSSRVLRPPRKEIGLDADTLRKIDELVEDVRDGSLEPGARASEVFRAIVQLVHEARHKVDYSRVSRRGQWGSPTARAFIAELREAFLKAVGALYEERRMDPAPREDTEATE